MDLLSARMKLIRHADDNLGYFYLPPSHNVAQTKSGIKKGTRKIDIYQ